MAAALDAIGIPPIFAPVAVEVINAVGSAVGGAIEDVFSSGTPYPAYQGAVVAAKVSDLAPPSDLQMAGARTEALVGQDLGQDVFSRREERN